MKHLLRKIVVPALLLGVVLTLLLSLQGSFQQQGDCANTQSGSLPGGIRRVDCSGRAYGLPLRFIKAKDRLDIMGLNSPNTSPSLIGTNATISLNMLNLLVDWLVWSVISFAGLGFVVYKLKMSKSKAKPVKVEAE
ncbi:MAG: hypothetical protein JWS12_484 [Candidatus Saccharibacteria bacterium]|nr:hypothetical protein [Candidatus Saccharibacteria bacterium]